jgi:hypothetical protein
MSQVRFQDKTKCATSGKAGFYVEKYEPGPFDCVADPKLAADLGNGHVALRSFQGVHDLAITEFRFLHVELRLPENSTSPNT